MSPGMANPTTCPRWRGPLAYGHAGATRIFRGSCCDIAPMLRAAGHQAKAGDRAQLGVPSAPVADAVDDRDRAELAPVRSRRAAESFEERTRADDGLARPRPRRQAPRLGHRRRQVRVLAVVEDEVEVAVALEAVFDDLAADPPDVSLEAGCPRRRRRARPGEAVDRRDARRLRPQADEVPL